MIDKGVCGKERPDFVFDMYKLILILEKDALCASYKSVVKFFGICFS